MGFNSFTGLVPVTNKKRAGKASEVKGLVCTLAGNRLEPIDTDNPHVLGYVRLAEEQCALVFANFSECQQVVRANQLRLYGLSYEFRSLLSGEAFPLGDLALEPYDFVCLAPVADG